MKFELEVKEALKEQIKDIFLYYESLANGLGFRFLNSWENAALKIQTNPIGFQKKYKDFRQVVLKSFPYIVMFEIENDRIIVYTIIHTSRKPKLRYKKSN